MTIPKDLRRRDLLALSASALLAVPTLAHAQTAKKGPPIRIGIIGPMQFVQGEHAWFAAQLAAEDLNKDGGILVGDQRRPVELVKVDTNEIRSTVDASNAVERAITVEKVDFLVGGASSGAILVMQEVTSDYKKIFLIAGSGSHPEITDRIGKNYNRYKYFFRPSPLNANHLVTVTAESVRELARVVREKLGIERPKIALLFEEAKWLDPQVPQYQKIFPEAGIDVVGLWRISTKDLDVSSQLSAIRSSGAHIILAMTSGPVAVPLYRSVGELQLPVVLTGINPEAEGAEFFSATGGHAAYLGVSATAPRVAFTPLSLPLYDRFVERFKTTPVLTIGSYDSILIVAEAITRAKTIESDAVVVELEKTDFASSRGRVVFDKTHDAVFKPGYLGTAAFQWLPDGKQKIWWATKDENGKAYPGVGEFEIPPWTIAYWKEHK